MTFMVLGYIGIFSSLGLILKVSTMACSMVPCAVEALCSLVCY